MLFREQFGPVLALSELIRSIEVAMGYFKRDLEKRAHKYAGRGQIAKAIEDYRQLVSIYAADIRLRRKLAELLAQFGNNQEAVENYLIVARKLRKKGFRNRAVPIFKRILELDPEHLDARMQLAELYLEEGFEREAVSHLRQAMAPLKRQGNQRTLLRVMKQLVELRPADLDIRRQVVEHFNRAGRRQEAAQLLAHSAMELSKTNQTEDFLLAAEQALELDHHNLALLNGLAKAHLERREIGLALQRLDLALQQEPNCVESLWLLARAFDLLGKPKKVAMVGRQLKEICDNRGDPTCVRKIVQEVSLLAGGVESGLIGRRQTPEEDLIAAQFDAATKKPDTISDQPTRVVHLPLGMFDVEDDVPEISSDEVVMLADDDDLDEVSGVYPA